MNEKNDISNDNDSLIDKDKKEEEKRKEEEKMREEERKGIDEDKRNIAQMYEELEKEQNRLNEKRKSLEAKEEILDMRIRTFEADEKMRLISEEGIKEKNDLGDLLETLTKQLKSRENRNSNISQVYENKLSHENINKKCIKNGTSNCLLNFMFYFISPLFGVIFLIGIFQLITIMKSLSSLLSKSFTTYYKCTFKNDCTIELVNNSNNEENVFDFYNYIRNNAINETIDFNLMMVTGFVGDSLLKSLGFRKASFMLGVVNVGILFWLSTFELDFKDEGIFDYDFFKILYMLGCYILLLIGVGGSALLSQQILTNSHEIYKEYTICQMKLERKEDRISEMDPVSINNNEPNGKGSKKETREEERQKRKEKKLRNKETDKFDYFFMICLITTAGYFGKYLINLLLNIALKSYFGKDYDKKYFFYGIIILYVISLILSIVLYSIFVCIFTKEKNDEKEGENRNKNIYQICQICGYFIYSQKITKNNIDCCKSCCKCCKLLCESTKNCCDNAGCSLCNILCQDDEDNCKCFCCCCCEYNEKDYSKDKESFCYCYQAQRKSYSCNKYFTNDTQKKIAPYMIEYFFLLFNTFAFEKIYEEKKGKYIHIKTFISVLGGSFILFFILTLSVAKFIKYVNDDSEDEKKGKKNEIISKLSNEILDGTHGILFFNGIFSLIFSSFYLSKNEDIKDLFFDKNTNIIILPILLNKLFYLTLNYYCTYQTEEKKNQDFELISGSTLISIYLSIFNLIIYFIQKIPSHHVLFIIQICFSCIPCFFVALFIIALIWVLLTECNIINILVCILSYLLCFGCLWYDYDAFYCIESTCYCELCCCDYLSCCYCECCEDKCGNCDICCDCC